MDILRIAMWSGPRNISTALMRAFENRPDCAVVDEPFYGYYLQATGLEHPAGDAVMASMSCDWREVARQLREELPATADPASCTVFYQKHMTQHILPAMQMDWTDGLSNCFLIREPRRIIASYAKVRPQFAIEELGFPQQWELFQRVADRLGEAPPVIDSAQTLRAPEASLRALCQRLAIPFTDRMLHWPAGRRDSDGVWAPHWYAAVEQSTGFQAVNELPLEEVAIPAGCEEMCDQAETIYARLFEHALVTGDE
ncbi:sulfotransferase-like domain-containing protein [Kineobactrum salinum]|uniref:HAD family hydrolase n=1 Tax=Kineobactrum salinum TaxID=2708301 RepID=A0A6C0TYS2_9GAMM|nr:HAD family hydrolase [Kineobactrum salinum]QIB64798.1 HAD family hydrolase [Kineobactrum salinum]